MRSPAKALHLSKIHAPNTQPTRPTAPSVAAGARQNAEGGLPHHGWREAPFGVKQVTGGQEALAFSSVLAGDGSAFAAAGAGAGFAAS